MRDAHSGMGGRGSLSGRSLHFSFSAYERGVSLDLVSRTVARHKADGLGVMAGIFRTVGRFVVGKPMDDRILLVDGEGDADLKKRAPANGLDDKADGFRPLPFFFLWTSWNSGWGGSSVSESQSSSLSMNLLYLLVLPVPVRLAFGVEGSSVIIGEVNCSIGELLSIDVET